MVKETDNKIKRYLELMNELKKLESELNFVYIVTGFDSNDKSIQQLQMTFLWNSGFALVNPFSFLVDQPAIKYAAPEDMPMKTVDSIRMKVLQIESDVINHEFQCLENYMV